MREKPTNQPYTIVVVDDDALFRFAVTKLLNLNTQIDIVHVATNGSELIAYLESCEHLPDLCLLDLGMPIMDGFVASGIVRKRWPAVEILIVSIFSNEYSIANLMHQGIRCFFSKRNDIHWIVDAILKSLENGKYYSPSISSSLVRRSERMAQLGLVLTPTEQKVLVHICGTQSYAVIAKLLSIQVTTLKAHVRNIMSKLNLHSREAIIVFAYENDLI